MQVTCGAELAALFVEALVKGKYACDDETLGKSATGPSSPSTATTTIPKYTHIHVPLDSTMED